MLTIDLEKLEIPNGSVILDLGCGKGRHLHKLYYFSKCHVIGLDLSIEELKATYQGFEQYPDISEEKDRKFSLMAGTAINLPFQDNSFDNIICSEVLEHIEDFEEVIKEIYRISKPGAKIGISVPRWFPEKICWSLSDDYYAPKAVGGHVRIYKKKELMKMISDTGLEPKGHHRVHALHSPYWWLRCIIGPNRPIQDNFLV